jgi:signal transduction histidine kinase
LRVNRPDRDTGRLEESLEAAPIGLARVDSDGRILAANREFVRVLGGKVERPLPSTVGELAPTIEAACKDLVGLTPGGSRLTRRTVTIGESSHERSIELIGWASAGSDGAPVASLLISESPRDAAALVLYEAVERARAAHEIHDGLAQDLWLAKLAASGLERNKSLDSEARALSAELLRSIDAALSEARTAMIAMSSVDVPSPPLSELIERQVNDFSDRFGIRAECHLEEDLPIAPRVAVEMLRVVQEALNNVRKHARPGRVVVRLARRQDAITLSVRDDGIGFDPAIVNDGYGRQSMRERAQSIGGRLTVASAPGRGTSVSVRVPIALAELTERRRP